MYPQIVIFDDGKRYDQLAYMVGVVGGQLCPQTTVIPLLAATYARVFFLLVKHRNHPKPFGVPGEMRLRGITVV